MAFLEQRGSRFRVIFRHAGRRYMHTLTTADVSTAHGLMCGIEKTLMLLDLKVLTVPDGVDVLAFIVSNGQVQLPATPANAEAPQTAREYATVDGWQSGHWTPQTWTARVVALRR